MKICIVIPIFLFWSFKHCSCQDAPSSPLILIPGLGGSRAYCNNTKLKVIHAWVNFWYILFPSQLTKLMKLNYDPITHRTSDQPGNNVFYSGWGSTESVENLNKYKRTIYFETLVKELVESPFYVRNKTLRGAPYDFRKTPKENVDFVPKMKELVMDTYRQSEDRKVILLGHSMGCLYTLQFLKVVPDTWKKKFVKAFICASGPLGGSMKSLKLEIKGDALMFLEKPIRYRELERSFPSAAFLLPKFEAFGNSPLVISKKRSYTALDYRELFHDMEYDTGYMMYNDTKDFLDVLTPPTGIDEIYCIYGFGLKTLKQLKCLDFPRPICDSIYGDGDATVNTESLEICKQWKIARIIRIEKAGHRVILQNKEFIKIIKSIINY